MNSSVKPPKSRSKKRNFKKSRKSKECSKKRKKN